MIGERCHKIQENDAMSITFFCLRFIFINFLLLEYIGGYFLLFDLTANIINNCIIFIFFFSLIGLKSNFLFK